MKSRAFADLASRQLAGDRAATEGIRALAITLEDGYCLANLYWEWEGAFSFDPGRIEALTPIAALAAKVAEFVEDDTLRLFESADWHRLVDLRGPAEAVQNMLCQQCGAAFIAIGTSGFYDASPLVCDGCGDVYFKAAGDDSATPRSACGGQYISGCPRCGWQNSVGVSELSPYEYFASHKFIRGPGA